MQVCAIHISRRLNNGSGLFANAIIRLVHLIPDAANSNRAPLEDKDKLRKKTTKLHTEFQRKPSVPLEALQERLYLKAFSLSLPDYLDQYVLFFNLILF